jgi:O-antigen/teichoic acid export membrane protein
MFDNVRRVTRQLATYGSADVALLVVNVFLLPVFTRVLSREEYGVLGILLVFEAGLKVVYRWGLDGAFLRLYYERSNDEDRRALAGTIAIILLAANGVILVGLALASGPVDQTFFPTRSYQTAFLVLLANSFISGFFFLPLTMFRAREQAARVAAFSVGRSLATIAVRVILVVGLRMGITGLVVADLIVSVGMTLVLWRAYRSMIRWRFSKRLASEALRYGFPHVPYGLMHQSMAFSDRLLLGLWLPANPLALIGLYQIANSFASLLKIVPVAFQTAWMPFAFDTVGRRRDATQLFARLATYSFAVLVLLTLGIVTLTDSVVILLLPDSYRDAAPLVPILALGITIQVAGWFPSTSLNVAKATRFYPIITACSAATTIAGHFVLIPRYGLFGAAWATVAGQSVQYLAMLTIAQRVYRIPYEAVRLLKIVLVGLGTYVLVTWTTFDSAAVTFGARLAVLGVFPIGLLAVGLLTAAERRDVKALAAAVRTRRTPHRTPKGGSGEEQDG